jgi:hypothetical protein
MSGSRLSLVLLVVLEFAAACGERPARTDVSPDRLTRIATDSPGVFPNDLTPDSTLRLFLSWSVPSRRPNSVNVNPIYACDEFEALENSVWIADGRIDSIQVKGDTATARTRLTTVARQVASDTGHVATLAVEERTASFALVREGGRWKVCANAVDGTDVFSLGGPASKTRWLPAGASGERAIAVIDSIRLARGLPLLR